MFEIRANKIGKPFLKNVDRHRNYAVDGDRGRWVEIGRATDLNIGYYIRRNMEAGHVVLIDDEGVYRMLVLTD